MRLIILKNQNGEHIEEWETNLTLEEFEQSEEYLGFRKELEEFDLDNKIDDIYFLIEE